MKLLKIGILTIIAGAGIPVSLYAAATFGTLVDLANTLAGGVVTSLGYLMFTLAVVAFFWGIVQFIWSARQGGDGKGMENGKQFMLWGLIALFVMFSVWGIITFTQGVFGIKGETNIVIPNIQLLGGSRPSTGSSANTSGTVAPITGSQSSNATFNACIAAGGGVGECRIRAGQSSVASDCTGGPNSACTTRDATGATVSGYCNNLSQCVPTRGVGVGGSCRVTAECRSGLECGGNGTCVSSTGGGTTQGSPCVKSVCSGSSCSNVTGTYNNLGQCVTPADQTASSRGNVGFGGSCTVSDDCSGTLVCDVNNQCRYPVGANCTDDIQCGGAGVCDISTKKCL